MGSSPLIRGLNHILCAVLGAGLFLLLVDFRPRSSEKPEEDDTTRKLPRKDVEKNFAEYRKAFREQPEKVPAGSHNALLNELELSDEAAPEEIEAAAILERDRLLTLADAYRDVADLATPLTEALSKQDTDTSLALFLAWHARDPESAFEELARRPDLFRWYVAASYPAMLALSTEELISQANRSDRSENFRKSLGNHLAQRLAYRGDLAELERHWTALEHGDDLARSFMNHWKPQDHEEAVKELTSTLPSNLQLDLARSVITDTVAWQLSGGAQVGEEIDPKETLRTFLWERSTQERLGDLNYFEDVEVPTNPDLWYYLTQEHKNYLGLFANGEVSAQEVADRMQEKLAGTEHEENLSQRIYHYLGRARPAEAIAWAQGNLSTEELAEESIRIMNLSSGPRTRRLADVVAALEPAWSNTNNWKSVSTRALKRFREWRERDPELAAAALAKIGPNHPIWSHQQAEGARP